MKERILKNLANILMLIGLFIIITIPDLPLLVIIACIVLLTGITIQMIIELRVPILTLKNEFNSNNLDLAELITKYGSNTHQDFEGFLNSEEQELIIKEIKNCVKIFEYKGEEFSQALCDIVLINIIGEFNEEDITLTNVIDKILETMMMWDGILSCRFLLKSGINWTKNKGE